MKPNLAELYAHVALKMKYIIQHTDRYKEKRLSLLVQWVGKEVYDMEEIADVCYTQNAFMSLQTAIYRNHTTVA